MNKEGPALSPEGDFFEEMDTIKVSHRSPGVPLHMISNWYWYVIFRRQFFNTISTAIIASQFWSSKTTSLALPYVGSRTLYCITTAYLGLTIGLYCTQSRFRMDFSRDTAPRTIG